MLAMQRRCWSFGEWLSIRRMGSGTRSKDQRPRSSNKRDNDPSDNRSEKSDTNTSERSQCMCHWCRDKTCFRTAFLEFELRTCNDVHATIKY